MINNIITETKIIFINVATIVTLHTVTELSSPIILHIDLHCVS